MRSFGVLLLLLVFEAVAPTPVFNRDGAGFQSEPRSARFGESIRDWFKMMKNRIVDKWHQWFDNDNPISRTLPKDILSIDRTLGDLGGRTQNNLNNFFLDMSDLNFDPQQDWGIRLGDWYIIRKIGRNRDPDSDSGSDYSSESEQWEIRPLMPKLPSPPVFNPSWKPPGPRDFDVPEVTRPLTTTPKIESITFQRETPKTVITEISVTSTEPTVTSTESISSESTTTNNETAAVSTESNAISTESKAISTESNAISTESNAISTESNAISTESNVIYTGPTFPITEITTLGSAEPITIPPTISTDSNVMTTEPAAMTTYSTVITSTEFIVTTTESTAIFTEPILTSTESTSVVTDSIVTLTQPAEVVTTTESPTTTTELILPVYNKRVGDNETVNKRAKKPNRPASAEVIIG